MLTSSNSQRGNVANQTELDFDLFAYLFIFSPHSDDKRVKMAEKPLKKPKNCAKRTG